MLANLVTEMGLRIKAYTVQLFQLSSMLWSQSANHHFTKSAILKLLDGVVKVLDCEFDQQDSLQPVLLHSLDLNSPDTYFLLEDGLALWLSTLRSAPQMTEVRLFFVSGCVSCEVKMSVEETRFCSPHPSYSRVESNASLPGRLRCAWSGLRAHAHMHGRHGDLYPPRWSDRSHRLPISPSS